MSCAAFDITAAHLLTYVHDVRLNVGTEDSSTGYVTEMKDAMAALGKDPTVWDTELESPV
jgi:hypothetical protein